jgi:hypothetical protein
MSTPADLQPIEALLAVAHHALRQGAEAEQRAEAAREAHDPELQTFLDEVRTQSLDIAERCKSLLAERLGRGSPRSAQQRVEEASEQSFPASDAPAF